MKTKFFTFALAVLASCFVINAATVTLSFSGVTTEGRYCLLDSVLIENLTENWSQTLDCSTDTTFVVDVPYATSVEDIYASKTSDELLTISQNVLYGSTSFSINPLTDGIVRMCVVDMTGRIVMEHGEYLCAGHHQYILQLGSPQTYILSVNTTTESAAVKLLSIVSTGSYDLCRLSSLPTIYQAPIRRAVKTDNDFLMRYTGYTNQQGEAVASEPITQTQNSNEQIVFRFAPVAKSQKGMYVGMMGFNSQLYPYSFDILTNDNLYDHQQFVSNLSMASGTILYHAVYTALDNIVKAPVPEKIENVSLVTFTDGLDIGSWRMNSDYPSEALYLAAVNKQIHRTNIDGVQLDAYAIGVKGSDVTDVNRFENDLHQLASDSANVYSVSNMEEVNARFREIAAKIYSTKVSYSLTIKLPAPEPGSVIRFTFDDIDDAKNSIYYIEGTYDYNFDEGIGVLKDVVYRGVKCSDGSTWSSIPDGIFDLFTIHDLSTNIGERVSTLNMRQWTYISSSDSWQINSEFKPSSNSTTTEERTSALAMLVLDCSSSLSSDFGKMQSAANNFLRILAGQGDISRPSLSKASYTLGDLQVTMQASVTSTGNLNITDKGFCVSEQPNMDDATFYTAGSGSDNFSLELSNLVAGRTYYCRPFADNQLGRSWGAMSSFTAIEYTAPTVTTADITDITINSGKCGGKVTSDGNSAVIERGLCWSTSAKPTVNDNVIQSGSGIGSFTATISNLQDGTTYYVRSYAKNCKEIGYGEVKLFTTITIELPIVATSDITEITTYSAICGGSITFEGVPSITERGICWSISPNPTIDDNAIKSGTGMGTFEVTISELQDGTKYYVRSYAKTPISVVYGEEKAFTTIAIVPPVVSLTSAKVKTANSANCIGKIISDGNSPILEQGFCWGTEPNPTIEGNHVIAKSTNFSASITNLLQNTDYYVRAYAKNEKFVGYSDETISSIVHISSITYTANKKLPWTSDYIKDGIYSAAFDAEILSHNFSNGNGTLIFTQKLTTIGEYAFYGCSDLLSVTIPNSVINVGINAFSDCNNLASPVYNVHVFAILLPTNYSGAYSIPDGIETIAGRAFKYCNNLTSVTIPNSVTSIGDEAFYGCSSLTSLSLPNSVTNIGKSAFAGCGSSPIYNAHIFAYMPSSFSGAYTIPDGIESIACNAFYDCNNLTSVTIPNSVISIGEKAFYSCSNLTSVSIPNSVINIGDYAFSDCSSLNTEIYNAHVFAYMPKSYSGAYTIPDGIESIAGCAFIHCSNLTSVFIPNSVISIGDEAFIGCNGITSPLYNAHVFAYMPKSYSGAYTIPDGIESIAGEAFEYCSSLTSVTIPNSVTSIGKSAFEHCSSLTSVTIPNSVTSIGERAFANCSGLISVTIPNSITSIESASFQGCGGLTSVTIPNSVTNIGSYAFSLCNSLTSVTIPNSVTRIGKHAFERGLTSLTCKASTPPSCGSAFLDVKKSIPLYVPASSISAYKNAIGWNEFTNIKAISE